MLTNYQRDTLNIALRNERQLALGRKSLEHIDTVLANAVVSLEYCAPNAREYWRSFIDEMTTLRGELEYQLRLEKQVPTKDLDPVTASAHKWLEGIFQSLGRNHAELERLIREIQERRDSYQERTDNWQVCNATEKMLKTLRWERTVADQGAWSGEDDTAAICDIDLAIEEAERMLSA